MSHGVPYLTKKRHGYRWEPGPRIRAQGWKGVNLQDENGEWLSIGMAIDAAIAINMKVQSLGGKLPDAMQQKYGKQPDGRSIAKAKREGYVYFLKSGNAFKIGFSKGPIKRASDIQTDLSNGISSLTLVKGTRTNEKTLHKLLARQNISGEWFEDCELVRTTIFRSIMLGRPACKELALAVSSDV